MPLVTGFTLEHERQAISAGVLVIHDSARHAAIGDDVDGLCVVCPAECRIGFLAR